MRLDSVKLGVIGCGNMGEAILRGVIGKKMVKPANVLVFDVQKSRASYIAKRYKVIPGKSVPEVVKRSGVTIVAVKPQDSESLLREMAPFINNNKLTVSVMAGVKLSGIAKLFKKKAPLARVMPNMAAMAGASMSSLCYNAAVKPQHAAIVRDIFASIGEIYETDEKKMNAITALAGSGPGFLMYVLEAFIEAAEDQGFSEKDAHKLINETFKGTGKALHALGLSPAELRQRVTSKGGTTEAGIRVFDKRLLRDIVKEAVRAAIWRANELGS